jgi:hypothetical protein
MTIMIANRTGVEVGYLAATYPGLLGHLYSPGAAKQGPYEFLPYALDKGAFSAWEKRRPWNASEWRLLLYWAALSGQRPLWALVPDMVADQVLPSGRRLCRRPQDGFGRTAAKRPICANSSSM